jgi:hypothetical protein
MIYENNFCEPMPLHSRFFTGLKSIEMKRSTIASIIIYLIAVLLFASWSAKAEVPQAERDALIALYNATDGDNWTNNTNWNTANPVSSWYGVTVTNNRVSNINLDNNNLVGTLPIDLGNIEGLAEFILRDNQLTGVIPSVLNNVYGSLDLSNNQLTGAIPPELGLSSGLSILDLSKNQLGGSIPPELGNLSNLQWLILEQNNLSGPIPPELGNLSNLVLLNLQTNQLSGELPVELSYLGNLTQFLLGENQLSGAIPNEISNMTNLLVLLLWSNNLSGDVPSGFTNLINLQSLSLHDNQLINVPDLSELGSLSLDVDSNKLTFEDIEPNIGISNITYSPQDQLPAPGPINITEGDELNISIPVGGTANVYQWFKDGAVISGANSDTYVVNSSSIADAGTYYLEITNTIATALTLRTDDIVVTVNPIAVDETDILTYQFTDATDQVSIDPVNHTVDVLVPYWVDVSKLVASFTLHSGAAATVNGQEQESEKNINDFTAPVTYTVRTLDGSGVQEWIVTVGIDPNTASDILSFSVAEQAKPAAIDLISHEIYLEVEAGTDLTSLTPSLTISSGASISPSGGVARDFTNEVTYTVTAQDGVSTQDWKVTINTNDGAVAYYPFNGNANDESGNGYHGTVYNAKLTTDRFNNPNSAYYFDGTNDYIEIPNSSQLTKSNESFTISFWARFLVNSGTNQHILGKFCCNNYRTDRDWGVYSVVSLS